MPRRTRPTEFPEGPEARAREIADRYHDGDFTIEPWFLSKADSIFAQSGMPLSRRERAVEGLRRVYTPDVCRALLMKPETASIVAFLFVQAWPGLVMDALQIGFDLAEIAPAWEDQLFSRLCNAKEYFGAMTELHVWANLFRSGRMCRRDPPGPLDRLKRPDFMTALGGRPYFIEIKATHRSAVEKLGEEVSAAVCSPSLIIEGYDLVLRPDAWILTRIEHASAHEEILESLDAIEKAFTAVIESLRGTRDPSGVYQVNPYGAIHVSPAEFGKGSIQCELIPELSPFRAAKRVVSQIVDCNQHLRAGAGVGVAFIETANRVDPRDVESLLSEHAAQRPAQLQKLGFACLRYFWRELGGGVTHEAHVIPLPWHRLTTAERRLARDLAV